MIQTFQTVSDDETAQRLHVREPRSAVWGLRGSGSATQVPLRYLYRGGLEQTGAYSSLTAPERESERAREREREREREIDRERERERERGEKKTQSP